MHYSLIALLLLLVAVSFYLFLTVKKQKGVLQKLEEQIRQLELEKVQEKGSYRTELVNELIDRYENEILKMGADIHDDLIQKLHLFRLHVDKLERVETILEMQVIADQMKTDFKTIVSSLRRITNRLVPEMEIESFPAMMRELCSRMAEPNRLFIYFETSGKEILLNKQHHQHLLRMVQELINNVSKHSTAWHIRVRLKYLHRFVEIEVEDDGKEFQHLAQKMEQPGTLSMLKMRASKIDAALHFERVDEGTKAVITYVPK
ncbi:MAG: hypothetical protein JNM57_05720 [Cyclobacteriaceae bacterium]|nr:hypothetical protein [Cyclobacteriaceae bacterium]